MASCCTCSGSGNLPKASLPLLCLVPRDGKGFHSSSSKPHPAAGPSAKSDFTLLSDDCIKKHFKLPQRALYLDPFRRPLITFPMNSANTNFNLAKKTKINQMILDGTLDPCTAITAPSVFPYAKNEAEKRKETAEDEEDEIIYILQLPDWEFKCPVHNQTIRTPRFIWHSVKKSQTKQKVSDSDTSDGLKRGRGPMHKPKPWLLSRHTDFDLLSQWRFMMNEKIVLLAKYMQLLRRQLLSSGRRMAECIHVEQIEDKYFESARLMDMEIN